MKSLTIKSIILGTLAFGNFVTVPVVAGGGGSQPISTALKEAIDRKDACEIVSIYRVLTEKLIDHSYYRLKADQASIHMSLKSISDDTLIDKIISYCAEIKDFYTLKELQSYGKHWKQHHHDTVNALIRSVEEDFAQQKEEESKVAATISRVRQKAAEKRARRRKLLFSRIKKAILASAALTAGCFGYRALDLRLGNIKNLMKNIIR